MTTPWAGRERRAAVIAVGLANDLAIWPNLRSDGEDLTRHARDFIPRPAEPLPSQGAPDTGYAAWQICHNVAYRI